MRARRAELLAASAGAALGAAATALSGRGAGVTAAIAVAGGALGLARRRPLAACLLAAAALAAAAAQDSLPAPAYVLAVALALCAGRWTPPRPGVAGAVALLAAAELDALVEHDSAIPAILLLGAAWGAGRALRDRERVAARLAERARELDDEREAYARLSVRFERARIAADLHDIVAHAISVMVVQATAGQRLAAVDPRLTAETFASIAGAAHQAEQDIERLVELLCDEGGGPPPGLALIEELVARAQASGLHVELRLEGDHDRLPDPVARLAYRVVQEGLTNALRYATGAPVAVLLRGEPAQLVVTVTDAGAPPAPGLAGAGGGNGLRGLREGVGALGGTLEAGATPAGGWRLAARLPSGLGRG